MANNNNDIIELLDLLYSMVNEAWSVPLGNDKCIIEREKAIEIINDVKALLPSSIAESKRLVSAREEFIGNAKREADALRKNAMEQSERMISEQEVLKEAQRRSEELLAETENKTGELKRAAGEYVSNLMAGAEKSLIEALQSVHSTQSSFRSTTEQAKPDKKEEKTEANEESEEEPKEEKTDKTVHAAFRKTTLPLKKRPVVPDIDDERNWVQR